MSIFASLYVIMPHFKEDRVFFFSGENNQSVLLKEFNILWQLNIFCKRQHESRSVVCTERYQWKRPSQMLGIALWLKSVYPKCVCIRVRHSQNWSEIMSDFLYMLTSMLRCSRANTFVCTLFMASCVHCYDYTLVCGLRLAILTLFPNDTV